MAYKTEEVNIDGTMLDVISGMYDVTWYSQRKTYEEKVSFLYPMIKNEGFVNFIDIGANYGFISLLMKLEMPDINIISIEADPRLADLVKNNFEKNNVEAPEIINAIVSDTDTKNHTFSLNPSSTLDNRVNMETWEKISVKSITIDNIFKQKKLAGKFFFKIDTQGYEMHILKGMENILKKSEWYIKMEFAPNWLESQGTSPLELLEYLALNYEFAEFPERIEFNTLLIADFFSKKIEKAQLAEFLSYVISLNKNRLGWVDLIVRPKNTNN